jgi:hypothetical protein
MTLEYLPLFVGPMAILGVCAVPIAWPQYLYGWRTTAFCLIAAVVVIVGLHPLLPDLGSARPLIATIVVGLGLPTCGLLALSIAERWSWRWTILLSASALALGVLHTTTPAYAADIGAAAPTSDPLMSLLLSVAGGQTPSWVSVILVAGLLLRQVNGIISKGIKVTVELVHTIPEGATRLDLHHHGTPCPVLSPDEGTDEHSGVRRRPRV